MNILHLDSSILGSQSASRTLTAAVVKRLAEGVPHANVTYRDLAAQPLPYFTAELAGVAGVPVEQRSETLRRDAAILATVIDELMAADVVVVGAPMYNFGISSQLKSWIDGIAVPGKSFRYGPQGVEGLLGGKRVVIASSRGNLYGPETPRSWMDHQENYLRTVLGFLGVKRIDVVRAEGLKLSPEAHAQGVEAGLKQAAALEAN